MPRAHPRSFRVHPLWGVAALLLLAAGAMSAERPAKAPGQDAGRQLRAQIPLGILGFTLEPSRRTLYVMSTAESSAFEGWSVTGEHADTVIDASGAPVERFPERVAFRVTASAMENLLEVPLDKITVNQDLNSLLLALRFRLKIFHGIEATELEPDRVEMLGMPAEVAYDERVYLASFVLPPTSIADRLVFEVFTPQGDRLCKFHLEF